MHQLAITFVGLTFQSPMGASAMVSPYRLAITFCIIAPAGLVATTLIKKARPLPAAHLIIATVAYIIEIALFH